jgi:hypothetical protein
MMMMMVVVVVVPFVKQLDPLLILSFDVMLIRMLLGNQVVDSDIGQVCFTLLFPHDK